MINIVSVIAATIEVITPRTTAARRRRRHRRPVSSRKIGDFRELLIDWSTWFNLAGSSVERTTVGEHQRTPGSEISCDYEPLLMAILLNEETLAPIISERA
jgi:hypothetical protein